jgi:hypothetical protein
MFALRLINSPERTQRPSRVRSAAAVLAMAICLVVLGAGVISNAAAADDNARSPKRANFEQERASRDARHVGDWIVDSGDNGGMPFMIVDKVEAKVFAFDADGRIRGAAPALLGLARGDDSVPGIGSRKLSTIRPEERTTPAGRFVASLDRNLHGADILWVDYEAAISLHRVITTLKDQRVQRLATPTPLDNRISYGCINVPAKFFDNVVIPAFTGTNGIVYILPETRSSQQVFSSYDVDERARSQTARGQVQATAADRSTF